ncbi:hypothetical protein pb186bvf_006296 [Paramecium bursaria]
MSIQVQPIGLDGSGKTSLINHMVRGDANRHDQESNYFSQNGVRFELNEDAARSDLILFCLDGSNFQQLPANKELISKINGKIIIVQTKSDIQTIDYDELRDFLGVDSTTPMVSVSSHNGEGMKELKQMMGEMFHQRFEFQAEPRVVQSRGKYKINQQTQVSKPQQTFDKLMQEKRIKIMDPMQQEQEYIRLEKERIKMENMHSQLNSFKKKPKKEELYDIKATANPKIQVNLMFFLTDSAGTIQTTTIPVETQTDEFKPKPKEPDYVPKKTGIDAATQVEDYELFDFDREVTPILDVICTKTLEQACLEIEQEEEYQAMIRFKDAFDKKRQNEKQRQKEVVENELEQIRIKNGILKKHRIKDLNIQRLVQKTQAMKIASQYLKPLQNHVIQQVFQSGLYPNEFEDQLKTQFLDWLVQKTHSEVLTIAQTTHQMKNVFTGQFDNILVARKPFDKVIEKKKQIQERRLLNYNSHEQRAIRITYYDNNPVQSVTLVALPKFLDGSYEEWRKTYETRIAELETKLDNNEIQEKDFLEQKRQEYPDLIENYQGLSVNNFRRLAFSFAHDQFYVTKDFKFKPMIMLVKSDGSYEVYDHTNQRQGKTIKLKKFRQKSLKVSDDEAFVIRLSDLSEEVVSILFGFYLPDVANNTKALEWTQNARFGIQDSEYYIPFAQTQVKSVFKFEDLLKVPEDPEQADAPQTAFFSCFILQKRYKQLGSWYVELATGQTKGFLKNEFEQFKEKLAIFLANHYESTLERDKDVLNVIAEKEKENPLNFEQKQIIISKSKLYSPRRQSDPNDSVPVTQANLDEPTDVIKSIFPHHTIDTLILDIADFEQAEGRIISHLTTYAGDLINSCPHGFELIARKKPFLKAKQLKYIREIAQLFIVRKPEPPPEPEEIVQPQDQDPVDDQDQ